MNGDTSAIREIIWGMLSRKPMTLSTRPTKPMTKWVGKDWDPITRVQFRPPSLSTPIGCQIFHSVLDAILFPWPYSTFFVPEIYMVPFFVLVWLNGSIIIPRCFSLCPPIPQPKLPFFQCKIPPPSSVL